MLLVTMVFQMYLCDIIDLIELRYARRKIKENIIYIYICIIYTYYIYVVVYLLCLYILDFVYKATLVIVVISRIDDMSLMVGAM